MTDRSCSSCTASAPKTSGAWPTGTCASSSGRTSATLPAWKGTGSRVATLRSLLDDGRVHLFDGAMGTMLYAKGFFLNVCYDELVLKQPRLVQDVHEEYVRAGAEVLETNTFGANPVKLGTYGLAEQTEQINRVAAELARRAAGDRASIVGAIGPLGLRLGPVGPPLAARAPGHFRAQVDGLLAGGGDGVVLETFRGTNQKHPALAAG